MPAIDYNAIMTPGGAAQGFAELASTITRIPQIRREQELKKLQIQMEQRRLDNQDRMYQSMAGYRGAMAGAATTRAGAYEQSVNDRGQSLRNMHSDRLLRLSEQGKHWTAQDDARAAMLAETKYGHDIEAARAQVEAEKSVPTQTRSPVSTDAYGKQTTTEIPRPAADVQAEQAQRRGLIPGRPTPTPMTDPAARGGAAYGQAMGGPPTAPAPAPANYVQTAPGPAMPAGPAAADPLDAAMQTVHPADQAAYQRIKALPDGPDKARRLAVVRQTYLGAQGAPAPAPAPGHRPGERRPPTLGHRSGERWAAADGCRPRGRRPQGTQRLRAGRSDARGARARPAIRQRRSARAAIRVGEGVRRSVSHARRHARRARRWADDAGAGPAWDPGAVWLGLGRRRGARPRARPDGARRARSREPGSE